MYTENYTLPEEANFIPIPSPCQSLGHPFPRGWTYCLSDSVQCPEIIFINLLSPGFLDWSLSRLDNRLECLSPQRRVD